MFHIYIGILFEKFNHAFVIFFFLAASVFFLFARGQHCALSEQRATCTVLDLAVSSQIHGGLYWFCWFNAGPPPATLIQHCVKFNIESIKRLVINVGLLMG